MPKLWVKETFLDADAGHIFGESDWYEAYSDHPGDIYRSARGLYGRCIGKAYLDDLDGKAKHVGWVFQGRDKYQDCDDTYLREVWVEFEFRPTEEEELEHVAGRMNAAAA